MKTLFSLNEGETSEIIGFQTGLSQDYTVELMDLGLIPGARFTVLRKYGSLDKVVLKMGENFITLRSGDSREIEVL
ncbi:MAG TPA: FeoA family protein [Leptospiraceae bacterium]|nr:FeoA family protein [Leptospiraceae bacterium]HNF13970.1 FeoA family protein [Leptospiraceae bacterium]